MTHGQYGLGQGAPTKEYTFKLTQREEGAVRALLSSMRDTHYAKYTPQETIIDCIAIMTAYAHGYVHSATHGQALATIAQARELVEKLDDL